MHHIWMDLVTSTHNSKELTQWLAVPMAYTTQKHWLAQDAWDKFPLVADATTGSRYTDVAHWSQSCQTLSVLSEK